MHVGGRASVPSWLGLVLVDSLVPRGQKFINFILRVVDPFQSNLPSKKNQF